MRLYVCGPTVYSWVHIGNARTFTIFDVVVRYLRHRGYRVSYVRNYTDVDDKIINAAREAGEDPAALADRYVQAFEEDAAELGLIPPDVAPRVTQVIPEILALIQALLDAAASPTPPAGTCTSRCRAGPSTRSSRAATWTICEPASGSPQAS